MAAYFELLILILTISGGTKAFSIKEPHLPKVRVMCNTAECFRSAENLRNSMNKTTNPCDDFYQFACGNWPNYHPLDNEYTSNTWFHERLNQVTQETQEFLERPNNETEPKAVHTARKLYKSCLDTESMDAKNLKPLEDILKKVGLSVKPPFSKSIRNFSWIFTSVKMYKTLGTSLFFQVSVTSDPTNKTVNKILISKPSDEEPLNSLFRNEKSFKFVEEGWQNLGEESKKNKNGVVWNFVSYAKSIVDVMNEYSKNKFKDPHHNLYLKCISTALKYSFKLSNLQSEPHPNSSSIPVSMTIEELQNFTDQVDESMSGTPIITWSEYLKLIFQDAKNVTIDWDSPGAMKLLVKDLEYLKEIILFLGSTSRRTHEIGMWWTVVKTIAPFTTNEMRKIDEKLLAGVSGTNITKPRSQYCVNVASKFMGMAVGYYYTLDSRFNDTKNKMTNMLKYLQFGFREVVEDAKWMDEKTKETMMDKIDYMEANIAIPDWLYTDLDSYYEGINVTDDFLDSLLNETQRLIMTNLNSLHGTNDPDETTFVIDPITVNAFYLQERNSMIIPAAMLAFPFYGNGIEAVNYGAIGTILGHEITHGFDDTGRQYDREGNLNAWWKKKTVNEYKKRAACFVDSYNAIYIDEIDSNVDGKLTLDENIADNGGLREALIAYQKYVEDNGPEPFLPGLENYTPEQILTLSFANMWCEHNTESSLLNSLEDEHSPSVARVWGVLVNSKEFDMIWKCKKGTPMNPNNKKCQIW